MTDDVSPHPAEVLDAEGESCAGLTPRIQARMRELEPGAVLEVRSDDPSARDGIASWSRLTGNDLLAAIEDGGRIRFLLRKKHPHA